MADNQNKTTGEPKKKTGTTKAKSETKSTPKAKGETKSTTKKSTAAKKTAQKTETVKKTTPTPKPSHDSPKKTVDTHKEREINVELLPDDANELITLYDDKDNPVNFFQIACADVDHEFYVLLAPEKPLEGLGDDEGIILKVVDDGSDDQQFVPVSDEETLDLIFEHYLAAVADTYGAFVDDDEDEQADEEDDD